MCGSQLSWQVCSFVLPHVLLPAAWESDTTVEIIVAIKDHEFVLRIEGRIMPPTKDIHIQIPENCEKTHNAWQREIKIVMGKHV